MRAHEEPILAERHCPTCSRTWLRKVDRVDRINVTRPSMCPDCQADQARAERLDRAFHRLVRPIVDQPSSLRDALCREVDPDLFYPEQGGSTRAAKAVCEKCPVKDDCLAWAVETRQVYGVWGGMSERERAKLAALGKRAAL